MELAGLFHYLITVTANIANSLTSYKRITSYISLTPEHSSRENIDWKKDTRPSIVIRDLNVKYRPELDYVLRDINLTIRAGCKLGVVGRTGSGKSSLLATLLKFVKPESGSITMF